MALFRLSALGHVIPLQRTAGKECVEYANDRVLTEPHLAPRKEPRPPWGF